MGSTMLGSGITAVAHRLTVKGHIVRQPDNGVVFAYRKCVVRLETLARETRSLEVGSRRYALVKVGDHVLVANDGRVYVNGQQRLGRAW